MTSHNALRPGHHRTTLYYPYEPGLTADAWSCGGSRVREVYVEILRDGRHLVTVKTRVPIPRTKGKKK